MMGDVVLKISHIGGLITTKYEEIIRLIFHTGAEAARQWGGEWPKNLEAYTEKEFTEIASPLASPEPSPAQSPESSMNFNDLNKPQKPSAPLEPVSSQTNEPSTAQTQLPNQSLPNLTSIPAETESPDVGPVHIASQVAPPTTSVIDSGTIHPPSLQPNTVTPEPSVQASLVFEKKELDNAYKMDATKFPTEFSIRFECIVDNSDSQIPPTIWDEDLYQEFITTHEVNKKNHSALSSVDRRVPPTPNIALRPTPPVEITTAPTPVIPIKASNSPFDASKENTKKDDHGYWSVLEKLERFTQDVFN